MRVKKQLVAALAAKQRAATEAEELCWLQLDDPACSKWRLASRDCWERVLQVLLGLKSPQPASCLSSLGLALHQQQLCMRALLQAGGEGCCDAIARPAGGGRQSTCSCEQPCDRCCRTRCVCREGSSSAGQPEVQSSPFPGDATTTPSLAAAPPRRPSSAACSLRPAGSLPQPGAAAHAQLELQQPEQQLSARQQDEQEQQAALWALLSWPLVLPEVQLPQPGSV